MAKTPAKEVSPISRRRFLVASMLAALGIAVGEALRIMLVFLTPNTTEGFGSVFEVGPASDFPPGSISHVRTGRFYLVHNESGFLAIYQGCTHLGCLVPWDEEEGVFACPCHAGRYDRRGEVISGPPPRPLDLMEVEIVDGLVQVDTSRITQRGGYDPSQAVRG